MDISAATHLEVTGTMRAAASFPQYTRLSGAIGPASHYVEMLNADVENPSSLPLNQRVNSTVSIYVPNGSTIYFSDYGTPAPVTSISQNATTVVHPEAPLPSGLVGLDGSPLSLSREKDDGPIVGLSGEDKRGNRYSLSVQTGLVTAKGRVSANATWVYSKATFIVNQEPSLETGISYSPSNMLVSLFFSHQNIQSLINVDLSGTGAGATMAVTRLVNYYGQSFSSQILDVPGSQSDPGMYLAVAPVRAFLEPVEYLSPGLKDMRNGLQTPPLASQTPLAALGSIQPILTQPEGQFVAQATALAVSALAPLAASFATPYILGPGDVAYWAGWMLTSGVGRQNLEKAFSSFYADYVTWAKANAGGSGFHGKWPTVLASSSDNAPAQQAINAILGIG
jgi:hypothetical protein